MATHLFSSKTALKGPPVQKLTQNFYALFVVTTILPNVLLFGIGFVTIQRLMEDGGKAVVSQVAGHVEETLRALPGNTFQEIDKTRLKLNLSESSSLRQLNELQRQTHASRVLWEPPSASAHVAGNTYYASSPATGQPVLQTHLLIGSKTLLVERPVDFEILKPNGPFELYVYTGMVKEQFNRHTPSIYIKDIPPWERPPGEMQYDRETITSRHGKPVRAPKAAMKRPPVPPHAGFPGGFGRPHPPHFDRSHQHRASFLLRDAYGSPLYTVSVSMFAPSRAGVPPFVWPTLILLCISGAVLGLLMTKKLQKEVVNPLNMLISGLDHVAQGKLEEAQLEAITPDSTLPPFIEQFNAMVTQLIEKETLRQHFMSNLTHDLKTPLIAQERVLDVFKQHFKKTHNADLEALADGMEKNNHYLIAMVNHVLELYAYEDKAHTFRRDRIAVGPLVQDAIEQVSALANEHHVTITNSLSLDAGLITGDAHALKRVLLNLLSNAIENIPKGATVDVQACETPDTIEVRVEDNGPGLSPEMLKTCFERYSGGQGDTRKIGSGLGLSICKLIIDGHGGTIRVDSQPGQTRFIVTLPKA